MPHKPKRVDIHPIPLLDMPVQFATINRLRLDTVWERSAQYDADGRGKVIEHIRATAPGKLSSEAPEAGWVGASGAPCREHNQHARPVWIWWTE